MNHFKMKTGSFFPRPQGLLLDDFQNGGSIRHFENRRGEGPGDEVDGSSKDNFRFHNRIITSDLPFLPVLVFKEKEKPFSPCSYQVLEILLKINLEIVGTQAIH